MEQTQVGAYQSITTHGFYYGSGSVTKHGPRFGKGYGNYDFSLTPIDEVDAIARRHDMAEHTSDFEDYGELRWVGADITLVKEMRSYLKNAQQDGSVDEYTGKAASGEALTAAANAIGLFEDVVKSKINQIDQLYESGEMNKEQYDAYQSIINEAQDE